MVELLMPKQSGSDDGNDKNVLRIKVAVVLALAAFAVVTAFGGIEADNAWVALAILLLAAVALSLNPSDIRNFVGRISELTVGNTSLKLAEREAKQAAAQAQPEDDSGEQAPANLIDLQLLLEAKMAYVAKFLLSAPDQAPAYITLGSLWYDKYLTQAQGRTAQRLMSLREGDRISEEFGNDAKSLVGNLRATVFRSMVRQKIETAGFETPDAATPAGERWDFVVQEETESNVAEGASLRVRPVLAVTGSRVSVQTAKEALANQPVQGVAREIIVVPDISPEETAREPSGPWVVRFSELSNSLEAARTELTPTG
jgi:hypothetical protein